MIISLIVAATRDYVIGNNGTIPWNQSADLQYFKNITFGSCVIMGRKTFESLPNQKPLVGRTNIVISRDKDLVIEGCYVVNSIQEALDIADSITTQQYCNETIPNSSSVIETNIKDSDDPECFIIGGEQIYRLALPYANRIYMTYIKEKIEGDTFFPKVEWSKWTISKYLIFKADSKNQYDYTFTIWDKHK